MESWSDLPTATTSSPLRRPTAERLRTALDGITQALASPACSLERVRRAVVRYGAIAHEQALQVDEMIATLTRDISAAIAPLPSMRRAELLASVQWWAVHGYHRAD